MLVTVVIFTNGDRGSFISGFGPREDSKNGKEDSSKDKRKKKRGKRDKRAGQHVDSYGNYNVTSITCMTLNRKFN